MKKLLSSCAMLAGLALISPDIAFAQEEDESSRRTLQPVIVTAERTENELQKVPIAVTAVSAETIERADISNPLDLSSRIPGFSFSPFNAGQAIFSLRGISSNDDGAGTENSVAVFLDDVYFGRVSNAAFDFFDVERIEVLRGPQGTQFGRNAIGGAINIASKKPNLEEFEGRVRVNLGDYRQRNFGAYVTGPIMDNLAFKTSVNVRKRDGYVTNILTGNDLKDQNSISARGQLLWMATPDTEVTFTASTQEEDTSDIARMPLPTAGVYRFFEGAGGSKEDMISVNPQDGFSKRISEIYSLKAQHELSNGGEFTSVTAYYKTKADWEMDSVGIPQANLIDDIVDRTKAFTQEFRYAQDLTEDIDVLFGVFYLREETDRAEFFRFVNFFGSGVDDRLAITPAGDTQDGVGGYRQVNTTNSIAGFVHGNWSINEQFSISGGLRITHDSKEISSSGFASGTDPTTGLPGTIINENFGNVNTGDGIDDDASFTDVSPKISLNWQATEDVLMYASYSKGYKAGGFGAAPPNAAKALEIQIDPEEANSFEVGLKGQFFDDTMRLNLAGFYLDYSGLQLQRFGPSLIADASAPDGFTVDPASFGFFSTINAGDAEVLGFEGELTWIPVEGLTLSATYAFLDTESEINFRDFFTVDPGEDFLFTQPLNRAPEHKTSLSVVYEHSLGDGMGDLQWSADYRYSASKRADFVNDDTIEDEYNLFDANITWIPENQNWQFQIWGKNLTDDRYYSHVYVIGPGQIGTLGEPRTYGASITWSF